MLFSYAQGATLAFTGILCALNNEMIDKFIYVCGCKENDDSDKINRGGPNKITGNKLNLQTTQPCCAQINRYICFTQRKLPQ